MLSFLMDMSDKTGIKVALPYFPNALLVSILIKSKPPKKRSSIEGIFTDNTVI
jgi:hypothetical protein